MEGIARNNSFVVFGQGGHGYLRRSAPGRPPGKRRQPCAPALGGSSANICAGLCKIWLRRRPLVTSVTDDAIGPLLPAMRTARLWRGDASISAAIGGAYQHLSWPSTRACWKNFQNVMYRNGAVDFEVTRGRRGAGRPMPPLAPVIGAGTVLAPPNPRGSATFACLRPGPGGWAAGDLRCGLPPVFLDLSGRKRRRFCPAPGAASSMIIGNDEEFGFMAGGFDMSRALEKARRPSARDRSRGRDLQNGSQGRHHLCQRSGGSTPGILPGDSASNPSVLATAFSRAFFPASPRGWTCRDAVLRGSACASIVVSNARDALRGDAR